MKGNSKGKVFLMGDNEAARCAIAIQLRLAGHEVFEATTAVEGLRLLEGQQPDVVILGVDLADISGLEIYRRIKSSPHTADLPVLHISAAFTSSSDRVERLDSGADGYLCGPIAPKELLAYVKVMVRLRRAERTLQMEKDFHENLERQAQERSAELREALSDLEHFSYTITHDLRAPLRAMRGFAAIMAEECQTCVTPARKDYLRRIEVAAQRMDKLIQDALDYSKIVRQELSLTPIDTRTLLKGIIESYPAFQSPRAEIEIAVTIPAVLGNQAAMTQCFSNLLDNALKFVQPGQVPQVRVWAEQRGTGDRIDGCSIEGLSVPQQSIQSDSASGCIRIWVEDNGIGIPKHCHERIFAMFQRLNKDYEGTGIGLALVRKAAERMGGGVGVESEPGRGSRFWVELRPALASGPQNARRQGINAIGHDATHPGNPSA